MARNEFKFVKRGEETRARLNGQVVARIIPNRTHTPDTIHEGEEDAKGFLAIVLDPNPNRKDKFEIELGNFRYKFQAKDAIRARVRQLYGIRFICEVCDGTTRSSDGFCYDCEEYYG